MEAKEIYQHLKTMLDGVVLRDLSGIDDKLPNVRPRTYELWIMNTEN